MGVSTATNPTAKKYVKAVAAANPSVDSAEFMWRHMLLTSAVALTATDRMKSNLVSTISGGKQDGAVLSCASR
ncbi:hypothetical protein [Bordetella bronchiseptica]|uniref:hypothetical protein n=1 Tax=Bordetella bronchiseptica TaxID=518 RepID=UPI003976F809